MRVAIFGTYARGEGYPRVEVLRRSLESAGVEVDEIHSELGLGVAGRVRGVSSFLRYPGLLLRIFRGLLRLRRKLRDCGVRDVFLVGAAGYFDVLCLSRWVRRCSGPRPLVVFDPFFSLSETVVGDRRLVPPGSLRARALGFLERRAARAADGMIADTNVHADHFAEIFGYPRCRIARVFVGTTATRSSRVGPFQGPESNLGHGKHHVRDCSDGVLRVLYVGTFVPLHGLETVIRAGAILEGRGVQIDLVGNGQNLPRVLELVNELAPSTITVHQGWKSHSELEGFYDRAQVALGVFGVGEKASRVIPCKVFDALALGLAVVTADTAAARELLVSRETALLTRPGDPDDLSQALLALREEPGLLDRLRSSGQELSDHGLSTASIGRELRIFLTSLTAHADSRVSPQEFDVQESQLMDIRTDRETPDIGVGSFRDGEDPKFQRESSKTGDGVFLGSGFDGKEPIAKENGDAEVETWERPPELLP